MSHGQSEAQMSNLTIENFWMPRLAVSPVDSGSPVRGWSVKSEGLSTFKEAPLALSTELSADDNPRSSPLLLVSAPGAVGKSTLARQIAHQTGAVYIDLAKADPVGGNTLSGGLVRSGLYANWQAGTTAVLIDGLDEARLRVTQEAFSAFLDDVAELAKGRTVPTILFGRTGAVQDAWLLLSDSGVETAVLEIGYYGPTASIDFAEARLRAARPNSPHTVAERRAVELLLERLREQTESDGDRFAGYAPVLQAVAERVARVGNPANLVADIERGEQPVTLQTVVSSILERERGKLDTLQFENPSLTRQLYSTDEQLDRLVARLYDLAPPALPLMSAKDAQTYSTALDTWVPEHPFLKGGRDTSSAVFDAVISTRALKNSASAEAAIQRELARGAAANPFLSEFYVADHGDVPVYLPPAHIGIIYASLRARLSLGDAASLLVEAPDDAEGEDALRAEVEITVARRDAERPRVLPFDTDQTGTLRLGAYVEDVEISAPYARVEIGPGPEVILVAPVSIQCEKLVLTTDKVIAENPPGRSETGIFLEAEKYDGGQMTSVPVVRGNVSLAAAWPRARAHPWTTFATEPLPIPDLRLDEALRRFRKFVIAFRSHSKGNLARYRHKIEHERMTKGAGRAVLNYMISEGILSLSGSMYYLDPDLLGARSGATYADCMARRFGEQTIEFVDRALKADGAT